MTADLSVGDKVGIKKDVLNYAGSWGIIRKIQNDEYHVAVTDNDDHVYTYLRTELRKWRTPKSVGSPETASETPAESGKGQLAIGQLPALKFNFRSVRALNDYRLFIEAEFNGSPYMVVLEGLTYGTMSDYVRNNNPEDHHFYENQRQDKGDK